MTGGMSPHSAHEPKRGTVDQERPVYPSHRRQKIPILGIGYETAAMRPGMTHRSRAARHVELGARQFHRTQNLAAQGTFQLIGRQAAKQLAKCRPVESQQDFAAYAVYDEGYRGCLAKALVMITRQTGSCSLRRRQECDVT